MLKKCPSYFLLSLPSAVGGTKWAVQPIPEPHSFISQLMVAAAMDRTVAPGRTDSSIVCAIAMVSPSRSRITQPERRSGIQLSIACSANSAKTGQAAHWIVSKPSSSMLARPLHVRGCMFVHGRSKGTIRRVSRLPMQKCGRLLSRKMISSLSGTTRSDPTENRELFFRGP